MKAWENVSGLDARSYQILRHLNKVSQLVTECSKWGHRVEPSSVKLCSAFLRFEQNFDKLCDALIIFNTLSQLYAIRDRSPQIFKQFKFFGALAECPELLKAFSRSITVFTLSLSFVTVTSQLMFCVSF